MLDQVDETIVFGEDRGTKETMLFVDDAEGELFKSRVHHEDEVYDRIAPKDEYSQVPVQRRPTKNMKKQINRGEIDIDLLGVSFDKFLHLSPTSNLTLDQLKEITRNLAIIPYNLVDVGHYDQQDAHPVILRLYPLNYEVHHQAKNTSGKWVVTPFPTLFWCYCPVIHDKVSQIEETGGVQMLQERLLSNPDYVKQMEVAHLAYAAERVRLLTEKDLQYVEEQNWLKAIQVPGIAGIRNFSAVKCLHCHYAHFLARPEHGNLIGQWTHELLLERGLI